MAKSNAEKARNVNTLTFGREMDNKPEQLAKYARPVPKHKREIGAIWAVLDTYEKQFGTLEIESGVSRSHASVFLELLKLAKRNVNNTITQAHCPACKETVDLCCSCGFPLSVDVPSPALEKNKLLALKTLADKMAPNLAAVSMEIDVNIIATQVRDIVVHIIENYVKAPDDRVAAGLYAQHALGRVVSDGQESVPLAECV
jgi:hypothetical protein